MDCMRLDIALSVVLLMIVLPLHNILRHYVLITALVEDNIDH
jgi:hypothetical protein